MITNFTSINIEESEQYFSFLRNSSQQVSDYTFGNIWGWAEEYGLEWTFNSDFALIKQTIPSVIYWAPIGNVEQIDWTKYKDILKNKTFTRVPESLMKIWENIFSPKIEECREHWDYIYQVEDLIKLSGNKFHKKKNLLSQFKKKYAYSYIICDQHMAGDVLAFQEKWFDWRSQEGDKTLEKENKAILKMLKSWEQMPDIFGAALAVEGQFVAYTLAEPLNDETVVIHVEKACPNHKGAYQAINQMFLENSCKHFKYVNREQDIGDLGLRQAKMSYNPIDFAKKYIVSF